MRAGAERWAKLSAWAIGRAWVTSASTGDTGPADADGSQDVGTGRHQDRVGMLLDPPLRRLVPRDVLAPPEGWEVPEALPPRPARCDLDDRPRPAPRAVVGKRSEVSA